MEMNEPTLAQRREALVAQCAAQRSEAAQEVSMMFAPSVSGGSLVSMLTRGAGIMELLKGRNLKVPLAIAGVVIGIVAVRPRRMVPLLTTGYALFQTLQPVLNMLRHPTR